MPMLNAFPDFHNLENIYSNLKNIEKNLETKTNFEEELKVIIIDEFIKYQIYN